MSEAFHSVAHVADQLGLHPKTVLRMIREGRVRATRIGKSYRIARSDFAALAGAAAAPPRTPVRVTATFDMPDLSPEAAGRLASALGAAVTGREARPEPLHLSTAYDPVRRSLKVVIIADAPDAIALIQTAHFIHEARP